MTKIDKLTSLMSKWTAQDKTRINSLNPIYINVDREDNQDIIMIRVIIKIGIDQVVEMEGHHSEVEFSKDRIIEKHHVISIII